MDDLRDELTSDWLDLAQDTRIGHPDWRGQGIGRALLGWQHQRGIQLVAARRSELGPRTPAILRTEVPSQASLAGVMFTHIGMTPARVSLTMRRDLTQPVERVPPPDGLTLVPYRPALDDALSQAHNTFFADHWGFQPWSEETGQHWATGHRPGPAEPGDGSLRGGRHAVRGPGHRR